MRCSNSAFDAQGSRVITVVLHVRTVKIYVAGGKMKDKDKTQFIIKTWVPVISFKKNFIPNYTFDALFCWKLAVFAP